MIVRKREVSTAILKQSLKKEIKDSAKEGAYEGVMNAKLDLLQNETRIEHNSRKLDYSAKSMPLTTLEFEKFLRTQYIIKVMLVSALFVFGFIDFKDVVGFFMGIIG